MSRKVKYAVLGLIFIDLKIIMKKINKNNTNKFLKSQITCTLTSKTSICPQTKIKL